MNNKHVADMLEIAPMSEPVAWMSANQKSFVHNLDIGDSVPNWTDYYTIPLYLHPADCGRDEALRMAREALSLFLDSHEECTDFDGFTAQIVSMDDYHSAQESLESIDAALKGVE